MISSFVLSQMVGLIHAPIFVFDKNEKLRTTYGARPEEIQFFEKNKMIVRILNTKSKDESPFIVGDRAIVLASVSAIGGAGDFVVVGPVATGGLDQSDYPVFERRFHMKYFEMVRLKMDEMATGLIMLHYLLNGEQVTKDQFWENNQKYFSAVRNDRKELEQENNTGADKARTENPVIHRVKNYIYSHLNSPIEVSEIAAALDLNPDYLSHLFSIQEKLTITDYIRKEKVRRGENLLRYSDYKICEISLYLGFCSQSHFSRVFKAVNGMTPNQYRKKYGTGTDWKIQEETALYSA